MSLVILAVRFYTQELQFLTVYPLAMDHARLIEFQILINFTKIMA